MDSGLTRRQVLQAGIAAGAVALSSDPLVQMASAAVTPPLGHTQSDIEHVIILIQENRSFDHYFGTYSGVEGYGSAVRQSRYTNRKATQPKASTASCCRSTSKRTTSPSASRTSRTAGVPQHRSWDSGAMDDIRPHAPANPTAIAGRRRRRWATTRKPTSRSTAALAERVHDLRPLPLLGARPDRPEPPVLDERRRSTRTGKTAARWWRRSRTGDPRQRPGSSPGRRCPRRCSSAGISWKVYNGDILRLRGQRAARYFKNFQDEPDTASKSRSETSYPKYFKQRPQPRRTAAGLLDQHSARSETEHPGNSGAEDRRDGRGATCSNAVMGHPDRRGKRRRSSSPGTRTEASSTTSRRRPRRPVRRASTSR